MRYNNYHKHTKYSSTLVPDTHIDMESYFKRAKELGHTNYYTVEHGFAGSIFEAKELGEKYGINVYFGMEIYLVKDKLIREKRGYHCVIIAKTDDARKQINRLNSLAHKDGFFYNARWSLEDVLSLKDVIITSACIGGLLKDDHSIEELFKPIVDKFKSDFLIEVHNYNHPDQIKHNKLALKLSEEMGLKLIHANDSHYIFPEQHQDRIGYLKGKGITYESEDDFILDYPDYEEIIERYNKQGVLSAEQIEESIKNTLILDDLEEIKIDKSIKMPTIYPNMSMKDKHLKLRKIIDENFNRIKVEDNIPNEKIKEYESAINYEFKIIEDTAEVKSVDYFLLNEKVINLAKDKYGGLLTKTGRGSNTAYYINRLLGFTEIDRLNLDLPLYPERFMSTTRLLETRSLPDNDYNTVSAKPFIEATREVLGEDNCYYMIAYGTMQEGEAFRNVCRNKKIQFSEFNEIAKHLDDYRDDKYWGKIIEESQKYIGCIISKSPSPCACLLMTESISEEIGLIRIKDELVAVINSNEAEDWKYLKNDYLQVSVWDIIYKTFDMIGIDPIPLSKLIDITRDDYSTWNMYELGLTATLNQADSDWATQLVKKYAPKSYREFAMWTSSIRPNFESFREDFLDRKEYTHEVKELDEMYDSTDQWILFQENLMQFFSWLGVPADHTVGLIKKIAKKKISEDDFNKLEKDLRSNWIKNTGSENMFDETWDKMQAMLGYGYNTPHACSVTFDSIYGAYLKSHYPLQYYTVILNEYQDDTEKTKKITKELSHFGIKLKPLEFGKSKSKYSFDEEKKEIYKGMKSAKFINDKIPEELNNLSHIEDFVDLLEKIKEDTSVNSRQLEVLIKIGYFNKFAKPKKLLKFVELYGKLSKKNYNKEKTSSEIIDLIKPYSEEKPKTFCLVDRVSAIDDLWCSIKDEGFGIAESLKYQFEYLGYAETDYEDKIKVANVKFSGKSKKGNHGCYLVNYKNGNEMWFSINKKGSFPKKDSIILITDVKKTAKGYELLDFIVLKDA